MSLGDGSGLSAADIMALSNNNDGYVCHALPNTCPVCYTVSDFCKDHPYGIYILCSGEHVVAVINGDYYDNWNSADEVPLYFYTKE